MCACVLGLATGLGFMVGPTVGGMLLKDHRQVRTGVRACVCVCMCVCVCVCVFGVCRVYEPSALVYVSVYVSVVAQLTVLAL